MLRSEYLYYFLSVARHSSINAAAQELNLTPPAISYAIKSLENDFNFQLFERSSKGMHLTKKGSLLLDKVEDVLTSLNELEEYIKQLNRTNNQSFAAPGSLTLFSESVIFDTQFYNISTDIYKKFPTIDLIIAEKNIEYVLEEIENNTETCALLFAGSDLLNRIANETSVRYTLFDSFPIELLAKKKSKWFGKKVPQSIFLNDVYKLPLIRCAWTSTSQYAVTNILNRATDNNVNYVATAASSAAFSAYLNNDVGVALAINVPFFNKMAARYRVAIPIKDVDLKINYCLLYNKNIQPDLLQFLEEVVKKNYNISKSGTYS